jgi:hypothetical protein
VVSGAAAEIFVDDDWVPAVEDTLGLFLEDVGSSVASGPESEVAVASAVFVLVGWEVLFADVVASFGPPLSLSRPKNPFNPEALPMLFRRPAILKKMK